MAGRRQAIAERLVERPGGGRFSFAHALVRDTLYEEVSPAQRAQLHERTASVLEELYGDDPERARRAGAPLPLRGPARGLRQGDRATPSAAASRRWSSSPTRRPRDLYERALEVLELKDEPDERRRAELALVLGGAEASAARISDARKAFGRAAESPRALGDADGLVGAAIGIAMLGEAGNCDDELVRLIDEALEAIGPEPSAARASLLSAKSQELYWVDAQGSRGAAGGGGGRDRPPG